MTMVFCRACAKEIHETAPTCPQCGASQHIALAATNGVDSPWLAIVSLILGIVCILTLFDDSVWDRDALFGVSILSVAGLACGIVSINQKKPGNNLAIAGVVLSAIAMLCFAGLSLN
jgi:peptidoglycan/LPS O-acetylase OafA/YrhL